MDFKTSDDGAVFRTGHNCALVQTMDFFTPIVDNPEDFGAISAANALSDIYAMGGKPLTALSIVCFPHKTLDIDILARICSGGAQTISSSGAMVVGGHSVSDDDIKFGYAVTGTVDPEQIWRNHTVKLHDSLVLTKPLGTGLLTTAVKQNHLKQKVLESPIREMKRLNKMACETGRCFEINAATDVTGFGLLGHLFEMLSPRNLGAELELTQLPLFPYVWEAIEKKALTGAHRTNKDYIQSYAMESTNTSNRFLPILLDPQTSGGLLFSLPRSEAEDLVQALHKQNHQAAIIGRVVKNPGFYFS